MLKSGKLTLLFIVFALICIAAAGCASAVDSGSEVDTASGYGTGTNSGTDNTAATETNSTGLAYSDWPSFQNDANNTGQSNNTGPQTNTTKWTFDNLTVYGSAVVGPDGTVYVGGYDGLLYAFSSRGVLMWTWATRSEILGSPTLGDDGTIYVSNWMNSTTYAISSNGTLIWKYTTGDYNFGSSPVIGCDGTIYITVTNETTGTLYAISSSGVVKWNYSMGLLWGNSPVIGVDGTIYVVDYDGIMYAINPNGVLKWFYRFVKTGTNNRPIYYVNMRFDTPSIGPDGTIYVANSGTSTVSGGTPFNWYFLFAIVDNGGSGSVKWVYNRNFNDQSDSPFRSILEPIYGAPAISSTGTIYLVSTSKVYAISSSGTLLWAYDTGGSAGEGLTSAIIGKDGTIYVGGRNGLFALIDNGSIATLKWHYDTGDIAGSPAIGNNGTLYVGSTTGTFYAFNDIGADFTVKEVNGTALTEEFNGSYSGNAVSWEWDFGDGKPVSTGQNVTHVYDKPGRYTVVLYVTLDDDNVFTRSKTVNIVERDITAPTVSANLTSGTYNNSQIVALDATDNMGSTVIYYTTDGTDPRNSSTQNIYTNPLVIDVNTVLKFVACDDSGNWSPVSNEVYNILHVVYVQNASYYNSAMINEDIQAILDDAQPGSTVAFLGARYENLQLVVNKKLNIVSVMGTQIVTNSMGSAVFLINGIQAAGTCISGFTIVTNTSSGILLNNTSNVTVSGVQVTSNGGSAVQIDGSYNSSINNSSLNDSSLGVQVTNSSNITLNGGLISNNGENGVKIYNSSNILINGTNITGNGLSGAEGTGKSGVYIDNSGYVTVTGSTINGNCYGITTKDITNTFINWNNINDNLRDGIILNGMSSNTNISSNYIQSNRNGIHINCTYENLLIEANIILNSIRDPNDDYYSGQGVVFGEGSNGASSILLTHNILLFNGHRDIETRYGKVPVNLNIPGTSYIPGSNWYNNACDGSCGMYFDPQMEIVVIRLGDGTYQFYWYDPVNKVYVTGIPSSKVDFIMGDDIQTRYTQNSTCYAVFPAAKLGSSLTVRLYQRTAVFSPFIPVTDPASGVQKTDLGKTDYSNNGVGNGLTGRGPGTGGGKNPGTATSSGVSGSSSSNGVSSGVMALGVAAAASAASAAGSSGSSGSGQDQGKTVQELLTNEIKKNPEFGGIIAVILLIIIVIGAYYRKDILAMIEKSRK